MSIIHTYIEQGSDAWFAVRLGMPTASQFHRIITASKGDLSKSAPKYAYELVAEALLGRSLFTPTTWAMQRGKELELQAVQQYEFANDVETRAVGFVTNDTGTIGCSPDRLIVGQSGGLEIKCQLDAGHIGTLVDGPGDDYRQQVQGSIAVAELEFWDLYAYHPELPPVQIRTYRDEPYIAKLEAALREFLGMRDAMLAQVLATGYFQTKQEAA